MFIYLFTVEPILANYCLQVLGCFLTRDNVTSVILHKLIIDCIEMLKNVGFNVHAVTSDGAQWNRGVWTIMKISPRNLFCAHPFLENMKLFFVSDFPHLAKCLRNNILQHKEFWVF